MQRPALLLLGVLTACGAKDTIATVFDPCSPMTIVVGPDTSSTELASVEAAASAWHDVLPTQIAVTSTPDPDALEIRFESGSTYYRAQYVDALGSISVSRARLAPADYAIALAHEMGHAFGLFHVDPAERPSVMNIGNLEVAPTAEDAAAVAALWEACRAPAN